MSDSTNRAKELRSKILNEQPLTLGEIKEAVTLLRANRVSACFASLGAAKAKAPKTRKTKKVAETSAEIKKDDVLNTLW